ncbi:microtubule-associated serine/threonine-protein kinase 3-like isoform X2 [Mytilus edulis]|uniref:microtubule-associated serine/threonine-protein kinase 3-like isoform X2 n=1 Tax=Mytilus edulis TaxID=6550 RepID=UPI0039F133A0
MSSRKSLSTKFSQAANKKQSKSKVGKKTEESKKDETSCKKKATKGGSKSTNADETAETFELQDQKKKIETESIVHIQKPIEIIQTLPINTESSHEKHFDVDIKTSDHDSDFGSKDLLRPIFRIGSVESSHDGEESALGEDDQVFELKRRTSSISSQGVDGGQSYSRQSSLQEDYEDMSLSSSGFSPGSTSASLKSFEGRNRIDDFSDDSDSNKLRESAEFSDDMEVAGFNFAVPYNKQLRIVTNLDPGLRLPKHDRRSSSPGGFESTGILRRRSLIFADFLSKRSLSMHLNHFPSDMTIEKFRKLTEEQLKDRFNFNHSYERACIMEAVRQAKKEDGDETDSDGGAPHSPGPPLSPSATYRRSQEDIPFCNPGGIRRLQRTLSEDVRQRRRESLTLPSSPISVPNNLVTAGSSSSCTSSNTIGHNLNALLEPTNLMRMKNTVLGQSAPSLTAGIKEYNMLNKRGKVRKSLVNISPVLPIRCPSPQQTQGHSPHDSPRNMSPSTHGSFAFNSAHNQVKKNADLESLYKDFSFGADRVAKVLATYQSQYSSQEKLNQLPYHPNNEDLGLYAKHFSGPHEGHMISLDDNDGRHSPLSPFQRPRSRSLSLSWLALIDTPGASPGGDEIVMMNGVYKDRFPKATSQMEERLRNFIDLHTKMETNHECDAISRFLHKQVLEMAKNTLEKSEQKQITSSYFYEVSESLEKLVEDAEEKEEEAYNYIYPLIKKLLLIISRPARLLECLEFDPEKFYKLLEEAEGQVKETVKKDVPQYIFNKLGLNKDSLKELTDPPLLDPDEIDTTDEARSHVPKFKTPTEEDFETIKLISNGAYASVYLVRHRGTRQRFAMKKICKQNVVLRNQTEQVFTERDIMSFTDNPFVVSMYCSFETQKHLCMVMEYVEGGDCATLLKNSGALVFDLARMYFAETVLALEYLHSYGIVHRDLKPDNLLITATGHIKLTDFGLSKIGLMSLTTNLYEGSMDKDCKQFRDKQVQGTPEYIAPEVILRQEYGKPVDWWSMGIILYEFLVGIAPFFGDTPEELFSQVINEELEWPEEEDWQVRDDAKDLIANLLQHNPINRLGSGGAAEVKDHIFFYGLDWDNLLRKKAEFVPNLDDDEDTSYFDPRSERYNHDIETAEDTEDEPEDSLFHSFNSCSPRYSKVYSKIEELHEYQDGESRRQNPEGESRRRHSSVDDMKTKILQLDRATLERKDSNLSESSDTSLELQSIMRQETLSTGTDSTDKTDSTIIRMDEDVFSSPECTPRFQHPKTSTPESGKSEKEYTATRKEKAPPIKSMIPKFAISSDDDNIITSPKELSPVDENKEKEHNSSSRKHIQKSLSATALTLLINPNDEFVVKPMTSPGGSSASSRDGSPSRDISPLARSLKPPLIINKGARGFGFTINSIRVYHGDSDVYSLQHIVTSVEQDGPAYETGLRPGDLITHVNDEQIHGLLHTNVVKMILKSGKELRVRTVPLEKSGIETMVRKKRAHPGKMARRATKKKSAKEKNTEKKKSRSLFRRLSTKKTDHIVLPPGPPPTGRSHSISAFSKSWSCGDSGHGMVRSSRSLPIQMPWSPDSSAANSSNSSSPSSSTPNSPASNSSHIGRPSSLHGLAKHKKQGSLKSPHRRKSVHNIPLSPLARTPSPSPLPPSPTRSPSPLAFTQSSAVYHAGTSNMPQQTFPSQLNTSGTNSSPPTNLSRKHSFTRPKSCEPSSPLLRRALSPDRLHPQSAEKTIMPQRKGSLQERKSSRFESL